MGNLPDVILGSKSGKRWGLCVCCGGEDINSAVRVIYARIAHSLGEVVKHFAAGERYVCRRLRAARSTLATCLRKKYLFHK